MQSKKAYLWLTIILFVTEVFIAMVVPSDSFIRHSVGDFLVVILIYCFVKSLIDVESLSLAIGVWIFSFIIEFAQYFHLVDVLGIENKIARIVIGTSFSMGDLVMYTLGCIVVYSVDVWWFKWHKR